VRPSETRADNEGMTGDGADMEGRTSNPAKGPPGVPKRDEDPRTWTQRYLTPPAPDSPFYSPPTSSKRLRWFLAIHLMVLAVFTVAVVRGILESDTVLGVIVLLLFWAIFAGWRAYLMRRILRELARRRVEKSASPLQRGSGTKSETDADDVKRRRKAAWARVRHDVFPILSNPSALKRPFDKRNDGKD